LLAKKKKSWKDSHWYVAIRNFWIQYRRLKIGLVGIFLLFVFVVTAAAAPWLATHDPNPDTKVSADFQAPQWMAIFDPTGVITRNYMEDSNLTIAPDIVIEGSSDEFSGAHYENTSDIGASYVNLTWTHTANTSLDFRPEPDPDETFPDCNDYIYLSRSIDWPYNKVPKDANISIDVRIEMAGDFASRSEGKNMFKIFVWLVDSSGNWTKIYTSAPPYSTKIKTKTFDINWFQVLDAWEGMIEVNGTQQDPEDKLTLAVGLAPTMLFQRYRTIEPWREYNGAVTLTVQSLSIVAFGDYFGWAGTTSKGADAWSQLVYGARVSLYIGVLATAISTAIGVIVGMTAGYLGGKTDEMLMRINDFLLVLPSLPLMMILAAFLERGINNIIIVIALVGWSGTARLIRSQVLAEKNKAYVESARAIGASDTYIMFRHILPNVTPILFANITLGVVGAILYESALSFLGLTDPSEPSWGRMLSDAQSGGAFTNGAWWLVLIPGFMITLISLGFTFVGHALDQVLNPRLRER
jgi:peptide/nickel transport system permease protein